MNHHLARRFAGRTPGWSNGRPIVDITLEIVTSPGHQRALSARERSGGHQFLQAAHFEGGQKELRAAAFEF
ncbi:MULTISPECIES: hypothetical protein [unclassified Amycolatopsis]|uniref:hypothetical protein n=1 Tax=unclassified Amycolatopsis TaxID=2618356 RepID=UPI00345558C6